MTLRKDDERRIFVQKENLDGMENSLEENKGQGATAETQIETSDGNQPEVILKEENPYSRTKRPPHHTPQ